MLSARHRKGRGVNNKGGEVVDLGASLKEVKQRFVIFIIIFIKKIFF